MWLQFEIREIAMSARRAAYSLTLAAALITVLLVPLSATSVEFTSNELGRLKQGKALHQPLPNSRQGGFYGGTGWIIADAPPDVVWQAIVDWESYHKIFPNTVSARELSRKGQRSLLEMKLGYKLISVLYHCEITRDDQRRILSFKLMEKLPHDIEAARGYWRLFPQQDGRTLIAYVVAVQVPMGLVNLLGDKLEAQLEGGLLNIPKHLKRWIESPAGNRYRSMVAEAK
jgi:ribosome-associated toxin RatA of RatAB toxin-antitoxin module